MSIYLRARDDCIYLLPKTTLPKGTLGSPPGDPWPATIARTLQTPALPICSISNLTYRDNLSSNSSNCYLIKLGYYWTYHVCQFREESHQSPLQSGRKLETRCFLQLPDDASVVAKIERLMQHLSCYCLSFFLPILLCMLNTFSPLLDSHFDAPVCGCTNLL